MKKIILSILLILIISDGYSKTNSILKTAEKVLTDLYEVNGNYIFIKPKILITSDKSNAALFLRRSNTIELSEKAYEVCLSMGTDSLSALAYILGHELAHAYQLNLHADSTSFLAYDRQNNTNTFFEESADVQGVFMTYLAGYNTNSILPEIIKKIYQKFDLPNNLSGYPTLLERMNTTIKVQKMTTELIQIFEAGNYLMAAGKYKLALSCYSYVEDWYKGREIYNNIGLVYINLAMNFNKSNLNPYLFPLEMNWSTRMKKPMVFRGGKEFSTDDKELLKYYLDNAHTNFLKASKMDIRLIGSEINIMCVMILKGLFKETIEYYSNKDISTRSLLFTKNNSYKQRINLVLAIAYANNNELSKAHEKWKIVLSNGNKLEKYQALFNLKIAKGAKGVNNFESKCIDIPGTNTLIDRVKLHRPTNKGTSIQLDSKNDINLFISSKPNSLLYVFNSGGTYFSLQRISKSLDYSFVDFNTEISYFTEQGIMLNCPESKKIFLLDKNRLLKEWVKYY